MSRKQGARKRAKADKDQSRMTTFLPEMSGGYGLARRQEPGFIVTDENGNEFLGVFSRNMKTNGTDVGYAIPDVMANEKLIERLIHMTPERQKNAAELQVWRAVLAILLLWDRWSSLRTSEWPELEIQHIMPLDNSTAANMTPFRRSILNALTGRRRKKGITLFQLSKRTDNVATVCALAMVSSDTIIVPAAHMPRALLDVMLPSYITWYDRETGTLLDPCPFLQDQDRTRLVTQLSMLQEMNDNPDFQSILSESGKPHLVGFLRSFIDDLNGHRSKWRARVDKGDPEAIKGLGDRLRAVEGLFCPGDEPCIQELHEHEDVVRVRELLDGVLMRELIGDPLAEKGDGILDDMTERLKAYGVTDTTKTYYVMRGVPFACRDVLYQLEPVGHPDEQDVMRELGEEADMMSQYSATWNQELSRRLTAIRDKAQNLVGARRHVISLMDDLIRHSRSAVSTNGVLDVRFPLNRERQALRVLMKEYFGDSDGLEVAYDVFSDCLTLVKGARPENWLPPMLAHYHAVVSDDQSDLPYFGLLSMSARMASWLMVEGEKALQIGNDSCPRYVPGTLSMKKTSNTLVPGGYTVDVSWCVEREITLPDAVVVNSMRFHNRYEYVPGSVLCRGGVLEITPEKLPRTVVWPGVQLPMGLWKQYYLWSEDLGGIVPRVLRGDEITRMQRNENERQAWFVAQTDHYPRFVIMMKDALSVGVACSGARQVTPRPGSNIVAGLDFGSTTTAVALRQGDTQPKPVAHVDSQHSALIGGPELKHALASDMRDTFVPFDALSRSADGICGRTPSVLYSAIEFFSFAESRMRTMLEDGHIYFVHSLPVTASKDKSRLYYNIKWGDEQYRRQSVQMFLRQLMTHVSLIACQDGAESLSWRVSLPTSMPIDRQDDYVQIVRNIANEVSEATGMPLTNSPETPSVSYASENAADGMFFYHENMINVQNGYINLDIGGSTSDLSLWLGGATTASIERSLRLGCRLMLFDSVYQHRDVFFAAFERAFAACEPQARMSFDQLCAALMEDLTLGHKREIATFCFDQWMRGDFDRIAVAMLSEGEEGGFLGAQILLGVSFLFFLCGVMLREAECNDELRGKLHETIQLCVAGNGGQIVRLLPEPARKRLIKFTDLFRFEHAQNRRVRTVHVVGSSKPKLEVAFGLVSASTSLMPSSENNAPLREQYSVIARTTQSSFYYEQMIGFFRLFIEQYPQSSALLLPRVLAPDDPSTLGPEAMYQLRIAVDNKFNPPDIFAEESADVFHAYIACFCSIKTIWGI